MTGPVIHHYSKAGGVPVGEIFRDAGHGSISQALPPRWEVIYRRFVWTPARLQRKGDLLFPAI